MVQKRHVEPVLADPFHRFTEPLYPCDPELRRFAARQHLLDQSRADRFIFDQQDIDTLLVHRLAGSTETQPAPQLNTRERCLDSKTAGRKLRRSRNAAFTRLCLDSKTAGQNDHLAWARDVREAPCGVPVSDNLNTGLIRLEPVNDPI